MRLAGQWQPLLSFWPTQTCDEERKRYRALPSFAVWVTGRCSRLERNQTLVFQPPQQPECHLTNDKPQLPSLMQSVENFEVSSVIFCKWPQPQKRLGLSQWRRCHSIDLVYQQNKRQQSEAAEQFLGVWETEREKPFSQRYLSDKWRSLAFLGENTLSKKEVSWLCSFPSLTQNGHLLHPFP